MMKMKCYVLIGLLGSLIVGVAAAGFYSRQPIQDVLNTAEAQGVTPAWIASRTDAEILAVVAAAHPEWTAADKRLLKLAKGPLRQALLKQARERRLQARTTAAITALKKLYPNATWKRVDDVVLISLDGRDLDGVELVGL